MRAMSDRYTGDGRIAITTAKEATRAGAATATTGKTGDDRRQWRRPDVCPAHRNVCNTSYRLEQENPQSIRNRGRINPLVK